MYFRAFESRKQTNSSDITMPNPMYGPPSPPTPCKSMEFHAEYHYRYLNSGYILPAINCSYLRPIETSLTSSSRITAFKPVVKDNINDLYKFGYPSPVEAPLPL